METTRPRPKSMMQMMSEILTATKEISDLRTEVSTLSNEIGGLRSTITDLTIKTEMGNQYSNNIPDYPVIPEEPIQEPPVV